MANRNQEPRVVDVPEECWLKLRPVSRGGYVPARIHKVLGHLVAEIDGVPASVDDVWAWGDRISERQWPRPDPHCSRAKPF